MWEVREFSVFIVSLHDILKGKIIKEIMGQQVCVCVCVCVYNSVEKWPQEIVFFTSIPDNSDKGGL